MVSSEARGAKDWGLVIEVGCALIVPIIYPIISKYLVPLIYSTGTPGDVVASGSLLVLLRAAAGTRGKLSTLHYTGASIVRYSMQKQQGGGAGEEERRRDEARERGEGRKRLLGLLVVR
jgi:hypothetical protein